MLNSIPLIRYTSSLDLASAYNQVSVEKKDTHKTAFTVRDTKYEYRRIPFGLINGPSFFCQIINETMYDLLGPNILVYMDNNIVFSEDKKTHVQRIEQVLKALDKAQLKLKIKKCKFFATELTFLGYKLTQKGMAMDEERTESIKKMPYPKSKNEVQAFLGTTNYFRYFIRNYANIAEPLYQLLRKGVNFKWNEERSLVVDTLKQKLSESPVLLYPDYTLPFHIYTDASEKGIGTCVLQENEKGFLQPVSYAARCLSETQRAYSVTKRELLALVFALENYRDMILHYEIYLYTDHRPLLGILTKPTKDAC